MVGDAVGYRVRFDHKGGPSTKLWFITEGIFGRRLGSDPFLEKIGVLVLDEFHERHLQSDVALAVARELRSTVRPDLKIVVMSATLDSHSLTRYLGDCPVIDSPGRAFPVDIQYDPEVDTRPLAGRVATAVRIALRDPADRGDILVFLPGAAEIRSAQSAIEEVGEAASAQTVVLHGDMPLAEQMKVLRRTAQRKIILSTNIAETSLTIDGVTTVIDSGLARIGEHDARLGVNRLLVLPISRASAQQRAGRAGRTRPGRCYRLWTRHQHIARREREIPEVHRLDLSGMMLELHAWGQRDLTSFFGWLDAPRRGALRRAERLLAVLGAIDADSGELTALGRRIVEMPAHPRVGRILIEAERNDVPTAGCLLAALVSEHDIWLARRVFGKSSARPSEADTSANLLDRIKLFERAEQRDFEPARCRVLGIDAAAARSVARARIHFAQLLGVEGTGPVPEADDDVLARCVFAGYPDRLACRRSPGWPRAVMVGRTGVRLADGDAVGESTLFVAVDVQASARRKNAEAVVYVASPVREEWLAEMFPHLLSVEDKIEFDEQRQRVAQVTRNLYADIVLRELRSFEVEPAAAAAVLFEAAVDNVEKALAGRRAEIALIERLCFLARHMPELGIPDDPDGILRPALEAACAGRSSFAELRQTDLVSIIRGLLSREQREALHKHAPEWIRLPNGQTARIAYAPEQTPTFAAKIQDLFGVHNTPRLAAGRVTLVVELLAPNGRPAQRTDDLKSFWRVTYPEVRKQLRGRYPKHDWPVDPLKPPAKAKPRG
jgi:ATP-dependent helicase HrpB